MDFKIDSFKIRKKIRECLGNFKIRKIPVLNLCRGSWIDGTEQNRDHILILHTDHADQQVNRYVPFSHFTTWFII